MLINRKNPHGGDIYSNRVSVDFSSNMNPEGMPGAVRQAVIDAAEYAGTYPDPFCGELRMRISESENIPYDSIICGNGAAELIYSYAYCLPKERPALVVSPTFSEYGSALDAAGVPFERYMLSESNGFRPDGGILREDLTGYSAVFICTPNNPTGITVDPELLEAVCGTGARVFCDMCFVPLSDDPLKYDIPRLVDTYPNLTVLKAFTKSFSMAGLRLGYAFCSDRVFIEEMSSKTQCWNVSSVAQKAGTAALGCGNWLAESVTRMRAERERLGKAVMECGIRVYPGEANYLLLYSEHDLYSLLLEKGILIRDCSNYEGLKKGFYRVAVRRRDENDMLISALREVIL